MGGIGDYIHYRAINYVKYGTGRPPIYGGSTSNFSLADQKAKLMTSIHASKANGMGSTAKQFARYIQWLMRPPDSRMGSDAYPSGESAELYNLAWEALLPFLQQEFGDAVDRISRASGNLFALVGGVDGFSKIDISKNKQSMYAGTIVKRLDAIERALAKGTYHVVDRLTGDEKDVKYTTEELQQLADFYMKLLKMKRELAADVQAQLDAVQIQNGPNNIREVLKETNSSLDLNGSLRDFVNQINQLSSLGRGAAAQYKGKLFEWMVVAAACIAQGLVGDSLKEAIAVGIGKANNISGSLSSMFLGDTATAVTYDPKDFISSTDLSSVLSSNYSKIGELYVANKASKDKVDVQISLPSGMGKVLNLSIKNKNLISQHAQPVDLVKSSPLLAMLASLQNHDFVNHYINQHAEHSYRAETQYNGSLASSIYSETARILALSIVEEAFRGYKTGAQKADVFVINDNISGTVQVLDIADILTDFINMDMNDLLSYLRIDPNLMAITFPNTWSENSAEDRITKILAAIHSIKVTVDILPGYFSRNINIAP